jgi:hypothetical protein
VSTDSEVMITKTAIVAQNSKTVLIDSMDAQFTALLGTVFVIKYDKCCGYGIDEQSNNCR